MPVRNDSYLLNWTVRPLNPELPNDLRFIFDRPYIIVSQGQSSVTEKHIASLKAGKLKFEDFIRSGKRIFYKNVKQESNRALFRGAGARSQLWFL